VHFLSLADIVPSGDRSYHASDMVHPSQKATDAIGARIAAFIRQAEAATN
jgi:lysophospholipase L1-like esterase